MKKITLLGLLFITSYINAQVFTENFTTNTGVTTSFSKTINGVVFNFVFSADGDGGDMAWESTYGEGNSSSLNLASSLTNTATTEKFTIKRNDGGQFKFTSIFINNTAGTTVNVAGYNATVLVGSVKSVTTGSSQVVSFGDIIVNEVRLSATDFLNTNFDSFKGDTNTALGLSESELENLKLTISPNPTTEYIKISGLKTAQSYSIYSALGAKILEGSVVDNQQIDVRELVKGIYFLQINTNNTIKFIKE